LGLLPGAYTPLVQEAVTRLGSRISYREAQEELEWFWRIGISIGSLRQITMRNGQIANELVTEEATRLEKEGPPAASQPENLIISADGAFIHLTNGEWREVKTVAFGEFESRWIKKQSKLETKTSNITYFSRLERAEQFGHSALCEWQQRGGENARQVVAVNDGAHWIQNFIDYHAPKAIRIIDFAHAQSYLATIGKAIYPPESDDFKRWFRQTSHQLKTEPPHRFLADLILLQTQHPDHPQSIEIEQAIRYLDSRQEMIDYAHFTRLNLPIGSGMVESGHKVVVQRRMKQAGMRWAEQNVNPMLALRMALCNHRWSSTWNAIYARACQARRQARFQRTHFLDISPPTQSVSEADCQRLTKLAKKIDSLSKPKRPWQNHGWIFPHRPRLLHRK
jgi:Uncharacterised protein family (UPF0236)